MKRFTERTIRDDYNNVDIIGVDLTKLYKELDDQQNPTLTFALNKLANLEDLEEEIGIDLITLFKALNSEKIWMKKHIGAGKFRIVEVNIRGLNINKYTNEITIRDENDHLHILYGYGKTWALTKEELLEGEEC